MVDQITEDIFGNIYWCNIRIKLVDKINTDPVTLPTAEWRKLNKSEVPETTTNEFIDMIKIEQAIDLVTNPPHYTAHPSGVDCITITEHMNFNLGNAIKYIWRASAKNGIEDLKKARWYIDREIARLGKQP